MARVAAVTEYSHPNNHVSRKRSRGTNTRRGSARKIARESPTLSMPDPVRPAFAWSYSDEAICAQMLLLRQSAAAHRAPRRCSPAASPSGATSEGSRASLGPSDPDLHVRDDAAHQRRGHDDRRLRTLGEAGRTRDPSTRVPSWDCFPNGGACRVTDDRIRLFIGQYRFAPALGGKQPFSGRLVHALHRQHGRRRALDRSERQRRRLPRLDRVLRLSNPHRLSDGRLMWAVQGTQRPADEDLAGRRQLTGAEGYDFSPP